MTILPLLACLAAAAAPAEQVLARAGDAAITRADVDERRRVLGARGRAITPADAVSALVDEALLAAEARRQGLDREPATVAQIEKQRRRLAFDAQAADHAAKAQPRDEQLRELFHSGADSVRLVLVKVETEADARGVLERARKGGDLAAEARRGVDPRLAAAGGDTGEVVRAVLDPALAVEVFRAPVGSLVGPVELKLGWAVARVVSRTIADEAMFPSRREALAAFARERLAAQMRAHLAEQVLREARVTIDEAAIDALGGRKDLTAAELDRPVATAHGRPVPYRDVAHAVDRIASAARGHSVSTRAKVGAVRQELEARLLGEAALANGYGAAPGVVATLGGIERNILAGALAARLAGGPADAAHPKVRERLDALRARTKVSVDRKAVAALGSRP
jgi:peptidyl-prolyl cis-trans isomerase C